MSDIGPDLKAFFTAEAHRVTLREDDPVPFVARRATTVQRRRVVVASMVTLVLVLGGVAGFAALRGQAVTAPPVTSVSPSISQPTQSPSPTTSPHPVAAVTAADLDSLRIPAGSSCRDMSSAFAGPVTLADGAAQATGGAEILTHRTVLADINGDAVTDGLAWLSCTSGASGYHEALFDLVAGAGTTAVEIPYGPDAASVVSGLQYADLSDLRLSPDGSTLVLTADGFGAGDASCCPSMSVVLTYRLGGERPRFLDATLRPTETPSASVDRDAILSAPIEPGVWAS